jgi:uncharacterized damage-inducible protein DinB
MTWVKHSQTLITYNQWANAKVLAAAAQVSDADLGKPISGSHHSVRGSLIHIVRVQEWWLSVLNGNPQRPSEPDATMPLAQVQEWFDRSHQGLGAYAAGLTARQLDSQVSAFNPWEKREYHWASWQLLAHLMNHSSHHRAEAGLMLESLGHSPGDLDLVFFLRE